jgi:hypothetical protein
MELINQLWANSPDEKGKIYSIKPWEMLKVLNVPSDFNYPDKQSQLLDYIHYQEADMDFYFIRNTSDQWVARECGFRQPNKIPELWNPITGEVIPVPVYNTSGGYTNIPLTFAPYASYFIVLKKGNPAPVYTSVSSLGSNAPMMHFTSNGMLFLKDGSFELKGKIGSKKIENHTGVQVINGPWNVSFTKGWGAPESAVFQNLTSWTENENPGIKYYSGIGTYKKTFKFQKASAPAKDEKIYLDLGDLAKVGDVWLNGKHLGITWVKPYRFDVTDVIKNGENSLVVEIANVWSNRLTGDANTGEKFTSTNIRSNIERASSWKDVPLVKSGLFGPVTIQTVKLVK